MYVYMWSPYREWIEWIECVVVVCFGTMDASSALSSAVEICMHMVCLNSEARPQVLMMNKLKCYRRSTFELEECLL